MPRLNHQFVVNQIDAHQLRRWWVAEQLGISRRTLQRWLNGSTANISNPAIKQLADILGCHTREIVAKEVSSSLATHQEQVEAAKALGNSDLLSTMTPGHQFALYTKLARGMLVTGLGKQELGALYMNLSLSQFRQGQLAEAGQYAAEAKAIALEVSDQHLLLRANMQLSYQAYLRGDARQCLKLDDENLNLAKLLEDKKLIAANLSNLGDQYLNFGDFSKSLSYQLEAIAQYEEIGCGVESNLAFCHLGLAALYLAQERFDDAAESISTARRWSGEGHFARGLADCDRFAALCCSALGEKNQAKQLLLDSEQVYEQLGINEVPVLIDQGLVYARIGESAQSRALLTKAVSLAGARQSVLLEAFAKKALVQTGHSEHREFVLQVFQAAGLDYQIEDMDG